MKNAGCGSYNHQDKHAGVTAYSAPGGHRAWGVRRAGGVVQGRRCAGYGVEMGVPPCRSRILPLTISIIMLVQRDATWTTA
jgi:hypothetical protein